MKLFKMPEMEMIKLEVADIITTSPEPIETGPNSTPVG